MRNKKTIRMYCYGPVGIGPQYGSPWEDVWLRFEVKRRVTEEGPCFISQPALEGDIWAERELLKDSGHKEYKEHHEEYLNSLLAIQDLFKIGLRYFCDNWGSNLPNIYIATGKKLLVRSDIEEATEWYLRKKDILHSEPRFQWDKPKVVITPVSFTAPESE